MSDYWERIRDDDKLVGARRKLSMDELRRLFQHARDSLTSPPLPQGDTVRLAADIVPYSSVVGGGLMLKKMDGSAGFIINFMGASQGITKEETAALAEQFRWFVNTYHCAVPSRPAALSPEDSANA